LSSEIIFSVPKVEIITHTVSISQ